jgi:phage terminase large subunit-like protein
MKWISMDDWKRGGEFTSVETYQRWREATVRELRERPWFLGIDLSTKLDMTALTAVCIDDNGVQHWLPWYWIPRDNIQDRSNVEADNYRIWLEQGFITATPGSAVEFDAITAKVKELSQIIKIRQIAYDPRFAEHLRQDLEKEGFECVESPQGYRLNEACKEFEAAVPDGRVQHGGHPVLTWNVDCLQVTQNTDGAVKPVKPDRLRSRKRIDGAVAGFMASLRAILMPTEEKKESVYARGVGV